jgi:hypothetical protein
LPWIAVNSSGQQARQPRFRPPWRHRAAESGSGASETSDAVLCIPDRSGRIAKGSATDVPDHPQAAYTRELIAALPQAPSRV